MYICENSSLQLSSYTKAHLLLQSTSRILIWHEPLTIAENVCPLWRKAQVLMLLLQRSSGLEARLIRCFICHLHL